MLERKSMKKIIFVFFIIIFNVTTAFCEEKEKKEENSTVKSSPFIYPAFMYSSDTGFGAGIAGIISYHTSSSKASTVQFASIYTEKKQFTLSTHWQHLFHGDKNRLVIQSAYVRFPKDFFGLGNNTSNENPESFTPEFIFARLFYEKVLINHFKIKAQFFIRNQSLVQSKPNGILKSPSIPWNTGRFDAGPGIGFLWDSRDNYYATKRGTLAQFEYFGLMLQDKGGAFNTFSFDVRTFFNPYSEYVFGNMFWLVDSRGDIPFYLLSMLGGSDRLRGYESDRFIGESLILFQHDIRFPIWGPFGGIVFIASGRVADNINSLFSGKYHTGYGLGLRYFINKKDNLIVRVDTAFGSDSKGTYITFSEAF